jgi:hypothetical protein
MQAAALLAGSRNCAASVGANSVTCSVINCRLQVAAWPTESFQNRNEPFS